jgi:hypothetical protein
MESIPVTDAGTRREADAEFCRRNQRAREKTINEKFAEVARLWDEARERMKAELRRDDPGADERRIHQFLVERSITCDRRKKSCEPKWRGCAGLLVFFVRSPAPGRYTSVFG